jgi:hypothetical protein
MNLRKRTLFVVPAALALAVGAGVGPASAAAGPNANCVGQIASGFNQFEPGLGGQYISEGAHESGGIGQIVRNKCSGV